MGGKRCDKGTTICVLFPHALQMGGGGSNPPSKYGWDIILYLHLGDFRAMFNPLILFVSFLKGVVCARNFYFIGLFVKNVEKLLH